LIKLAVEGGGGGGISTTEGEGIEAPLAGPPLTLFLKLLLEDFLFLSFNEEGGNGNVSGIGGVGGGGDPLNVLNDDPALDNAGGLLEVEEEVADNDSVDLLVLFLLFD